MTPNAINAVLAWSDNEGCTDACTACRPLPPFLVPDGSSGGVIAGAFKESVVAVAAMETPVDSAGKAETEMGRPVC